MILLISENQKVKNSSYRKGQEVRDKQISEMLEEHKISYVALQLSQSL